METIGIDLLARPPGVMHSALGFRPASETVSSSDVPDSEELGRLESLVDDTMTLVDSHNDRILLADVDSDLDDACCGFEVEVRDDLRRRVVRLFRRCQSHSARRQAVR